MNKTINEMRAQLATELTQVDEALGRLRGQRASVNADIKAKVKEQTELRSALARLTPRGSKPPVTEPEATTLRVAE